MSQYYILGLDDSLTDNVRETMLSPDYGHPVVRELAKGTGPCRSCLRQFDIGADERLLFTYRPQGGSGTLGAPGPVFIHSERCTQYRGQAFPEDLHSLPVILEGWARDNGLPTARRVQGTDADATLAELFADPDVAYVHVRHGGAGCHSARQPWCPSGRRRLRKPAGWTANVGTLRTRPSPGRPASRSSGIAFVRLCYPAASCCRRSGRPMVRAGSWTWIRSSRGSMSVQLVKRDGRWYILSITWDEENSGGPLPSRYRRQ